MWSGPIWHSALSRYTYPQTLMNNANLDMYFKILMISVDFDHGFPLASPFIPCIASAQKMVRCEVISGYWTRVLSWPFPFFCWPGFYTLILRMWSLMILIFASYSLQAKSAHKQLINLGDSAIHLDFHSPKLQGQIRYLPRAWLICLQFWLACTLQQNRYVIMDPRQPQAVSIFHSLSRFLYFITSLHILKEDTYMQSGKAWDK